MLQQYLNEHLAKNFIQSNYSSFAFLILFAKKLSKELQFCINYQVLNVITIQNQYSIFLIQETLNQLSKTQFFMKLDIIHTFNQIHICNKSLNMLCKRLMKEFLTSQHNEYSFMSHR